MYIKWLKIISFYIFLFYWSRSAARAAAPGHPDLMTWRSSRSWQHLQMSGGHDLVMMTCWLEKYNTCYTPIFGVTSTWQDDIFRTWWPDDLMTWQHDDIFRSWWPEHDQVRKSTRRRSAHNNCYIFLSVDYILTWRWHDQKMTWQHLQDMTTGWPLEKLRTSSEVEDMMT